MVSLVGKVDVARIAYQERDVAGLHPMDAALNLPPELYSHAVRRRAAEHAAAASFEEVSASLRATTGAAVGKRQAEELAARAAQDFDEFYATRKMTVEKTNDLLVLTFDGKGIPMRREDSEAETQSCGSPRRADCVRG
ncbi:MAG: hypothetical protein U0235_07635 [Polyangiaceae bacterium]